MIQKEEIMKIVKAINPNEEITEETQLLMEGVLDSLAIMTLAIRLGEAFHIDITIFDITPDNFATVNTITDLANRKMNLI